MELLAEAEVSWAQWEKYLDSSPATVGMSAKYLSPQSHRDKNSPLSWEVLVMQFGRGMADQAKKSRSSAGQRTLDANLQHAGRGLLF